MSQVSIGAGQSRKRNKNTNVNPQKKRGDPVHGTEEKAAKKFDDLVFGYTKNGRKEYRLLQAKHRLNEDKKITSDDLLTESDGDYSLIKYFFSYQDSKNEKLFEDGSIKDVIVCTNIDLDLDHLKDKQIKIHKIDDVDNILDTKTVTKQPTRYRFSEEVISLLKPKLQDYNLTRLAKRLANCLLKNNPIQHHKQNDIFQFYHAALAEEVIDVGKGKIHKFHDRFIKGENLSVEGEMFRKAFVEEIKKQSEKKLTLENINAAIMSKKIIIDDKRIGLNLSKNFGIRDGARVCPTGGQCLFDGGTKMIKFPKLRQFFPRFFALTGEHSIPDGGAQVPPDPPLAPPLFGIGTDKSWPNNAISDDEIKDYLNHLVFAVNQPNEEELGKIIKDEIGQEFNYIATEYVYDKFLKTMLDWLQGKEGERFLSNNDGKKLFEKAKQDLAKLELIALSLENRDKIEKLNIAFSEELTELKSFLTDRDKQIFNLIGTHDTVLSSVKVYHILQDICKYREDDGYILIHLDSLLGKRVQDLVIQAFNSEATNYLLVIECKARGEDIEGLYNQISQIIAIDVNKKVILITQENDPLANKFNSNFSDKYEEKKDKKNSLTDLVPESQKRFLEEGRVIFQGEEVSLGTLVDDRSKHLIDAEVLSKLKNKEKIEVGKELSDLGDVEYYYIDRVFSRWIRIKKECLKASIPDLFVISNAEQDKLSKLVSDEEKIRKFEDGDPDENNPIRFIILNNENAQENFRQLCSDYPNHAIHWLKIEKHTKYGSDKLDYRTYVDYRNDFIHFFKKEIEDGYFPNYDPYWLKSEESDYGEYPNHDNHWLKIEEYEELIWQQSHGTLSNLRKYVYDYISCRENELINKPINDKVVIISAKPGMGKSTVLTHLAEQTRQSYPSLWVVRVNLNDCTKNLAEVNFNNNTNRAIDFLWTVVNLKSVLEKELFKASFHEQGKIAVLFDGFDEISPTYKDKVIELLQILKSLKVEKLVITTRPYGIQSELEDKFSIFSYDLKPFDKKDQKHFLKKFWKKKFELNKLDDERFEVFTDELIKRFTESISDQGKKFMGIPLHVMMIAEIFEDEFKKVHNSGPNEWKATLIEKLNLSNLYEEFVEKKYFKIYCEDKMKKDFTIVGLSEEVKEKLYPEFIQEHGKLAMHSLFEKDDLDDVFPEIEKEVDVLIRNINLGKQKAGIIDKIINDKSHFVHKTFAEYFAASYLWEKFKLLEFDKFEDFIKIIIVENLILYDKVQICRFFQFEFQKDLGNNADFFSKKDKLNLLFAKLVDKTYKYCHDEYQSTAQSTKLLLKIIEFSLSIEELINLEIVQNLKFDKRLAKFDKRLALFDKRLALFSISAEMGYIKLANVLVEKLNTQLLKNHLEDDEWFYTPLWLAAKSGHLADVKILFEKLYCTTWRDRHRKILLQCIIESNEYDVLRSCLKLGIIDVNRSFCNSKGEDISPLVYCIRDFAPSDIIELLLEKTDMDFINQFKIGRIPAVAYITRYLVPYRENVIDSLKAKGMNVNNGSDSGTTPINVITCEFWNNSITVHKLLKGTLKGPFFHSGKEFSAFDSNKEFLNSFDSYSLLESNFFDSNSLLESNFSDSNSLLESNFFDSNRELSDLDSNKKFLHYFDSNSLLESNCFYSNSLLGSNFFDSNGEFSEFFKFVKSLLDYGAIYNLKDKDGNTAMQYVKQTHDIHQLFKAILEAADKGNDTVSNVLNKISDKVLQLIIKSPSTEYSDCFQGYKILENLKEIVLFPIYDNFKLMSGGKKCSRIPCENICFVPEYMRSLFLQAYEEGDITVIKNTFNELFHIIKEFQDEIVILKYRPSSQTVSGILTELKKKKNASANDSVMDLLERAMNFYVYQRYEIDEALTEVLQETSILSEKIQSYIKKLSKKAEKEHKERIYKIDEILNILGIKDSTIEEELMWKINEFKDIGFLNNVWQRLNDVGQKSKKEVLKCMCELSEQSSKTFELLKVIDNLFNAIITNNKEKVVRVLQSEEPSFIKTALNAGIKQDQTLLEYAYKHCDEEIKNLLGEHGAKVQGHQEPTRAPH